MSIIDLDRLENEYSGDEEILVEAAEVFIETLPDVRDRLVAAVKSGEAKPISETAHELKGMVGVFSLKEVYEACKKLEHMGRDNELAEKDAQVARVEELLDPFLNDLNQYIDILKKKLEA